MVSDAFSGYKALDKEEPDIRAAFCWAHVRRDYADALKALKGGAKDLAHETIAHKALIQIRRHKEVLPLVEAYFAWVREQEPATILGEKTRDG